MFGLAEKYILKINMMAPAGNIPGPPNGPFGTPPGTNNFGRILVKIIDSRRTGNVQRLPLARSLYV